jgi:3'-phosphoadenosine 5'-phosphosulfate (PAPS) 3'-phosphatase
MRTIDIGEKQKITLTDKERTQIVNNANIAAAAILENQVTGHQFVVYDMKKIENGKPTKERNIKKKLKEERIELFVDPDTGEKEREYTNIYKLVDPIKGAETFVKKSSNELTVLEKVTNKEEVILEEFGMSKEEILEVLKKEAKKEDKQDDKNKGILDKLIGK